MPRGTMIDTFKRDSLLVNFMREHKGEANRVSSHEVQKFLADNGYSVKRNNVGSLINRIMYERNAPICFSNVKGYYWAETRAEIEKNNRGYGDAPSFSPRAHKSSETVYHRIRS